MKIIEQNLTPKNPNKASEDGLVITTDFIAVIDGSTSKALRRHSRRMSNGRYAMTLISRFIRRMPANTSCHQFCTGVTAAIRRQYIPLFGIGKEKALAQLATHPEERLTASAVIYSRLRREIWLVGDCHCLINGEYIDNPKPYEDTLASLRAEAVRQQLSEGKMPEEILACDTARQTIIPQMLEEMRRGQNVTYAVIDGFPIPELRVKVIPLDFRPWEIVLASDGYPFLCPTLAESESRLEQQKATDPLNIGDFKATKGFSPGNNSFDDCTYIRFLV